MEFKEWNAEEIKEFAYETIETFIAEYKLTPRWKKFLKRLTERYIDFAESIPPLTVSGSKLVAILACAGMTTEKCLLMPPHAILVAREFLEYLVTKLDENLPEDFQ
jgi:hypothetical protein